jgi:polar amino acid transport system substrate-binding protein
MKTKFACKPSLIAVSFEFLLLTSLISSTSLAQTPQKIPLLIRETRNEMGEIRPIRPEIQKLLNYLEQETQLSFEIRYYPMTRLIQRVMEKEGIGFGITKTKERQKQLYFSDVIFSNNVWMIVRSDDTFKFNKLADLKDKTVGVVRGMTYGDSFDQQTNKLFKVEEDVNSHTARIKKLISFRMDILLFGTWETNPTSVTQLLKSILEENKEKESTSKLPIKVITTPLLIDELHFVSASEQDVALLNKLNLALSKGKASGEIFEILGISKAKK